MKYVALRSCGSRTKGAIFKDSSELEDHARRYNSTQEYWSYYELGNKVNVSVNINVEIAEENT